MAAAKDRFPRLGEPRWLHLFGGNKILVFDTTTTAVPGARLPGPKLLKPVLPTHVDLITRLEENVVFQFGNHPTALARRALAALGLYGLEGSNERIMFRAHFTYEGKLTSKTKESVAASVLNAADVPLVTAFLEALAVLNTLQQGLAEKGMFTDSILINSNLKAQVLHEDRKLWDVSAGVRLLPSEAVEGADEDAPAEDDGAAGLLPAAGEHAAVFFPRSVYNLAEESRWPMLADSAAHRCVKFEHPAGVSWTADKATSENTNGDVLHAACGPDGNPGNLNAIADAAPVPKGVNMAEVFARRPANQLALFFSKTPCTLLQVFPPVIGAVQPGAIDYVKRGRAGGAAAVAAGVHFGGTRGADPVAAGTLGGSSYAVTLKAEAIEAAGGHEYCGLCLQLQPLGSLVHNMVREAKGALGLNSQSFCHRRGKETKAGKQLRLFLASGTEAAATLEARLLACRKREIEELELRYPDLLARSS